ncbi:hypothetical protein L1D52_24070 [Vibrio brasiliensis]|uniref:hypothetical protein n=1 Tax=Vibrio brasiliensis TaxID=170652 RepID=UPI001EFD27A8|nr:hypothetical protein [Vibrio brasiliensis]MCG9785389.1 hypothetical protein [Vibrio brasiliensis]
MKNHNNLVAIMDGMVSNTVQTLYIDENGGKYQTKQNESWQTLECHPSDHLVRVSDNRWRLKNEQDTYLEEKAKIDKRRESEYTNRVRPYLEEAEIKKHMGEQAEYIRLMDLAVEERKKIQADNPWPTPPQS